MRFDIDDPDQADCGVFLDGEIQPNAVQADQNIGWVRLEHQRHTFFHGAKVHYETKWGKVHIVRMEGYEEEEYRAPHLRSSSRGD